MSSKAKTISNAKFYKEPAVAEEVYSGFLTKSPASTTLGKSFMTQKWWKKRYFILSTTAEGDYQLAYYRDKETSDRPLGHIELLKISLLFTGPETHPTWDWIQKHFKCPSSNVLFLRVETRDYFLIGKNSLEADAWLNAIVTALKKSQTKLQPPDESPQVNTDNRNRSTSAPMHPLKTQAKEQQDERRSGPALMSTLTRYSHYDYPRKLSEPPVPATRKLSEVETSDERDGEQEESSEESSEYMMMGSVQKALDDELKEMSDTWDQSEPTSDDHKTSVCNGIIHQEEDDKYKLDVRKSSRPTFLDFNNKCATDDQDKSASEQSEPETHHEKEICISQKSLKNSLVLKQEEGKPCVSECRQIQDSGLFHKGDQILAFNDLQVDTVEEIETYLRRLSKDEVKLTIRRLSGSQPLHCEACP